MARTSTAMAGPTKRKNPEDRKSGWDDWEVGECMWLLVRQKETADRAAKIRANAPLMKRIAELAKREQEEKRAERTVLAQLAKD